MKQIPIWNTALNAGKGAYEWPALGPTLTSTATQIDATVPARRYGVKLAYSPNTKAWVIPAAAPKNVCIYCNGLRYLAGADYTISGAQITPISTNMRLDALVVADFEE